MLSLPAISHALTGPVAVEGAAPGDVLELEILGYETDELRLDGRAARLRSAR